MDYSFRNNYCFNNAIRHFFNFSGLYFPTITYHSDDELKKNLGWSVPFTFFMKKNYEDDDFRKLKFPNLLNFKVCYDYFSELDNFNDVSKINKHSRMKLNYNTGTFKEQTYEKDIDNDLSLLCTKDYLLRMDIKSFYDGIYLHRLDAKDTFLNTLNKGQTNGLILGNYLSLFFAETFLNKISNRLDERFKEENIKCDYSYFSDDFFFFVNKNDIDIVKTIFSEVLSEFDLQVNGDKTRLLNYLEYNNDNILNRYWNKIVSNQNEHILKWHNECVNKGKNEDEIHQHYTIFNQLIYRSFKLADNRKQSVLVNSFFKSYYWNEADDYLSHIAFSISNTDVHQIIYLIKEYPECALYLIPKLNLSFLPIKDKIKNSIFILLEGSLNTKYFERQMYYTYILNYLDPEFDFNKLYDSIIKSNNQMLISYLIMFNKKFRDKFNTLDIEENLISSNDSWFLNYHTLLNYYNYGKISIEKVKELIEKYFIPSNFDIKIKYNMKAKQNLIDFYYNNILLKKSFIANTNEISESIKSYLKDRNHIEDKTTNSDSKTDCDDTMDFEDLPEYEEILDSKETLESIREDRHAEDDIPF